MKRIIAAIVVALLLASCGEKPERGNDLVVGFSVASDDLLLERWERDIKIFTSVARDLGAEVLLAKSPGDALGQIPQIQYLLDQGVDALVVIPQDMELLAGVIKKALDRGIPVLSYDRPVMGVPVTGYVSFDNREVGRLMGKALLSQRPSGDYLVVNGSVRDNNSFEINRGAREVLRPYLDAGSIRIVDEIWLEEWSFDEATEKIEKFFRDGGHADAILCGNDTLAGAAVRSLAERRLAGSVPVVGQDADLVACQRLVEGTQTMTVYKPISLLAGRAARLAVSFAKGEIPEAEQTLDNGSGVDIPYYVETPIAVTADNLDDTVLKDGFHSREDVYRTQ